MRKILFLDIDGVLNTERQHEYCHSRGISNSDEYGYLFDPIAVRNLAKIVNETGADIVISSSWKFYGLAWVREMWNVRNLPGHILDVTPNTICDEILLKADLDNYEFGVCRGNEIKEWLSGHQREVSNYVIIDDYDDLLTEQEDHAVLTDSRIGITEWDAEKAIMILNQ